MFGIVLAVLGFAEFGWGIATFSRDRVIAPRVASVVAIAPLVTWSALVVVATLVDASGITSTLPLLPMAIATVFELFAASVLARQGRRAATESTPSSSSAQPGTPGAPSVARYLLAVTAGAFVVGALTTPALAATEAGRYAQPHGAHDPSFVPSSDDHDLFLVDNSVHEGH